MGLSRDSYPYFSFKGRSVLMAYQLLMEKHADVLHVKSVGIRTIETVLAMSGDIMHACAQQGTVKVLVDVRALEGRLPTIDAYQVPNSLFSEIRDREIIQKCAIVDLKEFENSYRFFENVAVNRGYNLRIFSDVNDAIKWLQK